MVKVGVPLLKIPYARELFTQFHQDDISVIPQAVKDNLLAILRDIETLHSKARLQISELALLARA